jgi:hypothetical protein
MAIPRNQLETWSHQGAIAGSRDTYAKVKQNLEAANTPYASKTASKVFLQGSYCNDTNIYSESDVDIIIVATGMFQSDKTELSEEEKKAFAKSFKDAAYTHLEFADDVLKALTNTFGTDAKRGTKAISIDARNNRRKADVIPAIEFRRYRKFNGIYDQSYYSGICFYDKSGEMIANYPKQHSANMTTKHQSTNGWLKPMVRILKNMRSRMVEDGLIKEGSAPSYYIEGLLYNVPDDKYTDSYERCFINAINWIHKADKTNFVCANGQYYLLRDNVPTCWRISDGEAFLAAAAKLWNDW